MTKRIVSGIFILTALGALGVILAGALTSGEQLIVRFLTAVIVAALGLYVISDLRLQADDDATTSRTKVRARLSAVDAPPNSTAAFMATVTKKGDGRTGRKDAQRVGKAGDDRIDLPDVSVGATPSSTSEPVSAVVEGAGSPGGPPTPEPTGPAPVTVRGTELPELNGRPSATVTELFGDRRREDQQRESWPGGPTPPGTDAPDTIVVDVAPPTIATPTVDADLPAGTDGQPPTEGPVTTGDDVELTRPNAVIDFEYSGELQAPDYAWPAPPLPPAAAEAIATATSPATSPTGGHLFATDPTGAEGRGDERGDAEGERTSERVAVNPDILEIPGILEGTESPHEATPEPDDGRPSPPLLNGQHRSLPIPLAGAAAGAADYADAPLAPIIDLRNAAGCNNLDLAIRSGELEVIATLIEQGMLSTSGPITDRDVRTMVYVAFTSNELRKLLLAGGRPDGPNRGLELGPVELFDESQHAPAPKTLYPGLPETEPRSQLG